MLFYTLFAAEHNLIPSAAFGDDSSLICGEDFLSDGSLNPNCVGDTFRRIDSDDDDGLLANVHSGPAPILPRPRLPKQQEEAPVPQDTIEVIHGKMTEWIKGLQTRESSSEYFRARVEKHFLTANESVVLDEIKKDLEETLTIDPKNQLFLTFLRMTKSAEGQKITVDTDDNWYFEGKKLIINVRGEGNCFFHALFESAPELLIQLGFTSEEIISYINSDRLYFTINRNIINPARERIASMITKEMLDTKFQFESENEIYKNELEIYALPDTVRSLLKIALDCVFNDISDEVLIVHAKAHIGSAREYIDTKIARLLAHIFNINISVSPMEEKDARDGYLNVEVKEPLKTTHLVFQSTIHGNQNQFSKMHYRKLIDLNDIVIEDMELPLPAEAAASVDAVVNPSEVEKLSENAVLTSPTPLS